MIKKKCTICNIEKDISEFSFRNDSNRYRNHCKKCKCIQRANYLLKNPWKRTLTHIKERCENKKHTYYNYYGGRGIECRITTDELKKLWFRDKAYLMKKPSIDRIDNNGNYEYGNCRYIENIKNIQKAMNKTIFQFDLDGNFIKEWKRIKDASLFYNGSQSNITHCLKQQNKSAFGFIWKYK